VAPLPGASRGIGRAIAERLAARGATVACVATSAENCAATVAACEGYSTQAAGYGVDVPATEAVAALVKEVQQELGSLDILVNNAGITRDRSFMKLSAEHWREVLLVNLDGAFNLTSRLLPQMVESKWGRVINMSSIVAQMGNFGQTNYAVAKGGLIAFTKTLAREVARKGITVNAVAPGFIDTDMTAVVPKQALDEVRKLTPMNRLGTADEVAVAVRFLADPCASFITGQVINVNGGMYM